jgi:urea transport system substrate-binding protein
MGLKKLVLSFFIQFPASACAVSGHGFYGDSHPPLLLGGSSLFGVAPSVNHHKETPTHMKLLKHVALAILAGAIFSLPAIAQDTVKVGVLHSLSGTMAISETSLRDILLFTFDEINAKGGVLGKKIEPVVVDGASNWPLFAEKATQLLEQDKVAVTFGCWTSVSRKSVLPVFEKNKGLLFYPVQYEGEELSPNIFYTAEAVNQQATPAVDYLLDTLKKKKFYLLGSDYVYPQTTNLVLLEYLLSKGVPLENIGGGFKKDESGKIISAGKYTPFGHTDYQQIVAEIKQFAAGGKACVVNTLNGDTNVPFFKEYAAAGLTAESCPVVSFSISEDEFRGLPAKQLVGQLGCWTYFQSIKSPENKKFIADWQAWLKKTETPGIVKENRVTCSPMVLSYNGVYLWKKAVEKAKSFDVDKVVAALEEGISFDGPGGTVKTQKNHHLTKNVFIGETKADGQFKILKEYKNVFGEPFLKGTFKAKTAAK